MNLNDANIAYTPFFSQRPIGDIRNMPTSVAPEGHGMASSTPQIQDYMNSKCHNDPRETTKEAFSNQWKWPKIIKK